MAVRVASAVRVGVTGRVVSIGTVGVIVAGMRTVIVRVTVLADSRRAGTGFEVGTGAVGGAIMLGPCNEWFGRRWSILISCILYTIGAALEAGAINFGKPIFWRPASSRVQGRR